MPKKLPPHPMQPIYLDKHGVARFRQNNIVRFLQEWASSRGMNLNDLHMLGYDKEEWEQFNQLIGYSVSGWGELSCHRAKTVAKADAEVERLLAKKGKNDV